MKKVIKILISTILSILLILIGLAFANKLMADKMLEYADSFGAVEYENQLIPEYDECGMAYFTTDKDFKVMHFTDVHIGGSIFSVREDKAALNAMAAMIYAEKPDLVVISGDISFAVPWGGTVNNSYAHNYFIRFMENLGVYWTVAFGNHDSEIYNYYDRAAVADMYENENLKYCLFDKGPDDIFGECNHAINVRNSQGLVTKSIIMIDSNSYTDEDPLGTEWIYDNIHEDQINWYKNLISGLNEHNAKLLAEMDESERPENIENFTTVQSLLFLHIPPMEVRNAYNEYLDAGETDTENVKYLEGYIGEKDPFVYSSNEEDEMFETMLELGSTKAVFYGHDHLNYAVMDYKGIILSYGYSIDYFAYWQIDKTGAQRGCTVINCSPDANFEIIHENYYQDKYVPVYDKEIVDMTK